MSNNLDSKQSIYIIKEKLQKNIEESYIEQVGGFSFLDSFINGIQNLNPQRKTRMEMFLSDSAKLCQRQQLFSNINNIIALLTNYSSYINLKDKCLKQKDNLLELLNKNKLIALDAIRNLETSYRALDMFYKNANRDKLNNVSILNASRAQIVDLDNSRFSDCVMSEFKLNYDKLDLKKNYSLLVIGGYLGSNAVLDKWAKIAYTNKVMLFTDFADLEEPQDVLELFDSSYHASGDLYKSNTVMSCNWIVARHKHAGIGELTDLHLPPSFALCGKIYNSLMSQVTAGKKYGALNEVNAVVFPLKKSEISAIENIGLVPMVFEFGKVMAFSAKTLFNGDNPGLQVYSVVRVFDYITKVLIDFLNRRSFENWTNKTEMDLRAEIVKFLDSIEGHDRLIERFKIQRFERDTKNKDRVYLDVYISPFFPAKSFVIKLDGTKGNGQADWKTEYGLEK